MPLISGRNQIKNEQRMYSGALIEQKYAGTSENWAKILTMKVTAKWIEELIMD